MSLKADPKEPAGLEQLAAFPGVMHVLLVQSDGLLIAQRSAAGGAAKEAFQGAVIRVAAMTATALSLNKRIVGALGGGVLTETSIAGTEGKISLYAVGTHVVLALVTEKDVDAQLLSAQVKAVLETFAAA